MQVSAILAVASLCLAGLAKAASVVGTPAYRIVKLAENCEREICVDYVLSSMEAINERESTERDI